MKRPVRSLLLGIATLLGSLAFAQPTPPYPVTITGQVLPCNPANSFVSIATVQNTQPVIDIDVPLDANCSYSVTLMLDDPQGWIQVGVPCSGVMQYAVWTYQVSSLDTTVVVANVSCGPDSCQAAFGVEQAMGGGALIPWQITTTNLSTGPAPIFYEWSMPDGSTSTSAQPSFTFTQPGVYGLCLTISAGTCTSQFCDTVVVDSLGFISNTSAWYDCQGVLWGPNMPGTSCTVPGSTITGIWSANCVCISDTSATGCQACIITSQDTTPAGGLIPFSVQFQSCSSGDEPISFNWILSNGASSTLPNPVFQLTAEGTYAICLTINDASGCTSFTCDTLTVGTDGTITSGTPPPCQAGFWAIQAYDSTATGGVEPIPNEVWVWNLSSGGTPPYQFAWNFGDGTTSSEAYPTHEYDGPGPWLLCLTMYSGNCIDTYCDSLSMDANGILNGMVIDGHGAASNTRSGGFTLNVIQQMPTGIAEFPAFADLKSWPNPVGDVLNISFNNSMAGTVPLTVIDPGGRLVIAETHNLVIGNNTLRVPTDQLEQGLYMVRIGNGPQQITQRFLKVR